MLCACCSARSAHVHSGARLLRHGAHRRRLRAGLERVQHLRDPCDACLRTNSPTHTCICATNSFDCLQVLAHTSTTCGASTCWSFLSPGLQQQLCDVPLLWCRPTLLLLWCWARLRIVVLGRVLPAQRRALRATHVVRGRLVHGRLLDARGLRAGRVVRLAGRALRGRPRFTSCTCAAGCPHASSTGRPDTPRRMRRRAPAWHPWPAARPGRWHHRPGLPWPAGGQE